MRALEKQPGEYGQVFPEACKGANQSTPVSRLPALFWLWKPTFFAFFWASRVIQSAKLRNSLANSIGYGPVRTWPLFVCAGECDALN